MESKVLFGIIKATFFVGLGIYISILITGYFMDIVSRKCNNVAGIATCWPVETSAVLLPPLFFVLGEVFLLLRFKKIIPKSSILIFSVGTFTILCVLFLTSLNLAFESWQLSIIYPAVFVGYYLLFGVIHRYENGKNI
jgi:hypothetical protein